MILAIDFGGTRIRAAWFEQDAGAPGGVKMVGRAEQLTRVADGQEAVIARILETAAGVMPAGAKPEMIGMAAPGPLNGKAGIIYHAETLPGWKDVPLAQIVLEKFGAPVYMENDANLAAVAEYRIGAGQGADPMIYLTISTGIGGGCIINGKLFTGWSGLGFEPGHMRVADPDGGYVSLESIASGTGIAGEAWYLFQDHDTAANGTQRQFHPFSTAEEVGKAARTGHKEAHAIIERAGYLLGIGFVNMFHLLSPQAIVVGGSVALGSGDLLFEPARRTLADHILDPLFLPPDWLRMAALGDDVCLYGAALWSVEQSKDQHRGAEGTEKN